MLDGPTVRAQLVLSCGVPFEPDESKTPKRQLLESRRLVRFEPMALR